MGLLKTASAITEQVTNTICHVQEKGKAPGKQQQPSYQTRQQCSKSLIVVRARCRIRKPRRQQ